MARIDCSTKHRDGEKNCRGHAILAYVATDQALRERGRLVSTLCDARTKAPSGIEPCRLSASHDSGTTDLTRSSTKPKYAQSTLRGNVCQCYRLCRRAARIVCCLYTVCSIKRGFDASRKTWCTIIHSVRRGPGRILGASPTTSAKRSEQTQLKIYLCQLKAQPWSQAQSSCLDHRP